MEHELLSDKHRRHSLNIFCRGYMWEFKCSSKRSNTRRRRWQRCQLVKTRFDNIWPMLMCSKQKQSFPLQNLSHVLPPAGSTQAVPLIWMFQKTSKGMVTQTFMPSKYRGLTLTKVDIHAKPCCNLPFHRRQMFLFVLFLVLARTEREKRRLRSATDTFP